MLGDPRPILVRISGDENASPADGARSPRSGKSSVGSRSSRFGDELEDARSSPLLERTNLREL